MDYCWTGRNYAEALSVSRAQLGLPPERAYESPQEKENRLATEALETLKRYEQQAQQPAHLNWPKASPYLERTLKDHPAFRPEASKPKTDQSQLQDENIPAELGD